MSVALNVFNQYYFDLLRKVKDIARDMKHKCDDTHARELLREIKRNYLSYDRLSGEYRDWYRDAMKSFDVFEDPQQWYAKEGIVELQPYKNISIGLIGKVLKSKDVLLYYLTLLSVFAEEMSDEKAEKILQALKNKPLKADDLNAFDDMALQQKLVVLDTIQRSDAPSSSGADVFKNIEDTSLGKLAKEIINEIDLEEIQKNVGENGDILTALTNPDSGITKLLGTVSQKMISKMASGELRQENLLQDAMKLASALPGMTGGGKAGGNGGGLGDLSSMMDQVSNIASMFGGGAGGGGAGDLLSQFMKATTSSSSGGSRTKTQVNQSAMNRVAKAKQLRRKLEERRKTKENIE